MEEEDIIKLAELSVATLSAEEEQLLESWLEKSIINKAKELK